MQQGPDEAVHASKRARRQRERRSHLIEGRRDRMLPIEPAEKGLQEEALDGLQPHELMFPVEEWS